LPLQVEYVGRLLKSGILEVLIMCRVIPCWPLGPGPGMHVLLGLLAVAGVVFSIVMLVDCLRRPASRFYHPLTKNGEYDRLIWATAIVVSLWFYFLGAIVYFFAVRQARPENSQQ